MPSKNSRKPRIFSVGHSNLPMADLLGSLIRHEIRALCDVRSKPRSFRFPQFNRKALEAQLATAKITYHFFGETLGGRPPDPSFYFADGLVNYSARRKAPDFLQSIDRVIALSREENTAVMCAEEDPLHCHRFLLICPALIQHDAAAVHLRKGAVLETQREVEDRLLQQHGFADVTSDSLFAHGREAALEDALRLQSERYAFRTSPEAIEYF